MRTHYISTLVKNGSETMGIPVAILCCCVIIGMTVTNEPGYYEDNKFGIRIESVLLVKKVRLSGGGVF